MHNVSKSFVPFPWTQWLFFLSLMVMILPAAPAVAHKTIVFAWIEGDTVYTQSKFAGGRAAKNALVEVFDDRGSRLIEGRTDAKGAFSFKFPKKSEMTIVVSAGPGHRGEWTLSAGEFEDAPPLSHTSHTNAAEKKGISDSQPAIKQLPEEIQAVVEKALDKKLKPILKQLAESRNQDSKFRDIFGGIGYIFGLVGLGAYIHYRKRGTGKASDDD